MRQMSSDGIKPAPQLILAICKQHGIIDETHISWATQPTFDELIQIVEEEQ